MTNICSDKTGTLTQGKMVARKAWIRERQGSRSLTVHDTGSPFDPTNGYVKIDGDDLELDTEISPKNGYVRGSKEISNFLRAIALCNLSTVYRSSGKAASDATISPDAAEWTAMGEPTEIALHVLAMRLGQGKEDLLREGGKKLVAEFSFDSSTKRMTVVYHDATTDKSEALTKGATEVLLPLLACSDTEKRQIQENADEMAGEGLRVLCIARRDLPKGHPTSVRADVEASLDFIGLVGLYDPPRLETAEAVRRCQMAGISVHMLTGDHIRTATAIAHEVGILVGVAPLAQQGTAIMIAQEFDKMTDEQIDAMQTLPLVIARCSPSTKVRMVEAMHRRRAFCVMTGDGVNDSPALKRADVGIAMGLNGSDVAKEAADMVLTDDNFASIVKAVEEGRRLFDNIQKVSGTLASDDISPSDFILDDAVD